MHTIHAARATTAPTHHQNHQMHPTIQPITHGYHSTESVNEALASIGYGFIEIHDFLWGEGHIIMIFETLDIFGETHTFTNFTDCVNAQEWMEQFFAGRWSDIFSTPKLH
jgi:hypothetical protein